MESKSTAKELQELFELYQSGALSKEEYNKLKIQLLQSKNNPISIELENEKISLENQLDRISEKEESVKKAKIENRNSNSEGILTEKQDTATFKANKTKKSKRHYIGIYLILLLIIAVGIWKFTNVTGLFNDDIKDKILWKNKYIEVTTFNDFNGQEVDLDHQKSFFCYGFGPLLGNSNTSFYLTYLLDTLPVDHIFYVFLEDASKTDNEKTRAISGLKIEHLTSSQINATISVRGENPNDKNSSYFTIVLDYKEDGEVIECKTYKFDVKRKKLVENTNDPVICKVEFGDD